MRSNSRSHVSYWRCAAQAARAQLMRRHRHTRAAGELPPFLLLLDSSGPPAVYALLYALVDSSLPALSSRHRRLLSLTLPLCSATAAAAAVRTSGRRIICSSSGQRLGTAHVPSSTPRPRYSPHVSTQGIGTALSAHQSPRRFWPRCTTCTGTTSCTRSSTFGSAQSAPPYGHRHSLSRAGGRAGMRPR